MNTKIRVALAAGAVVAASSLASAGLPTLTGWNFIISAGSGDIAYNAASNPDSWEIRLLEGGRGDTVQIWEVIGSFEVPGQFSGTFRLEMDPDPFISSFFTINNLTNNLQPYTVTALLPTIALPSPTSVFGSTTGTVGDGDGLIDQFGNGATVRTLAGAPYYEALVDGAGVQQLYPDFSSHAAPQGFVQSIPNVPFGPQAGPALVGQIGIRNSFELTPGDNASFTSTFNIIPAPSGIAALGMLGLAVARRRR